MLQISVKCFHLKYSSRMENHSIENLCLIANGKFSKLVNSWTEKILYVKSG